jgi:hypothetical protein
LVGNLGLLNGARTKCLFINNVLTYLNELGAMALEEVHENKEELKINKSYYDLISSTNHVTYLEIGKLIDIAATVS